MLKTNGFIKKMVSRVVAAALPIGFITPPAPTMPEQDMGEIASTIMDVGTGRVFETNDGRPQLITADSNKGIASVVPDASSANPLDKYTVSPRAVRELGTNYKEPPKTGFMGSGGYATNLTGSYPMKEGTYRNMQGVLRGEGRGAPGYAERRQLNAHEQRIISGNLSGYHDITGP